MTPNLSRSTDAQLAARIAGGDREAFADFLDTYGPRVHCLSRRYAEGEADAEDLTQEIFHDLYRSLSGFRGEAQLATYVYRVALNHCIRYNQKVGRIKAATDESFDEERHESADTGADPARHSLQRELAAQVHGALDGLSARHRDVVILHELHGLTYTQCAGVLGVPTGTVKSRLSNAFRALRSSLGPYVTGEPGPSDSIVASHSPLSAHPEIAGESL